MSRENFDSLVRKQHTAATLAPSVVQSNSAPKVSTIKRTQDVQQAVWEDDDEPHFLNVRKKIRSSLTALVTELHQDVELDYLIKSTKGLVTSNREIWNRVKANLKSPLNKQFNQLSEKPELVFQRVGFNVVKVLSETDGCGRSEDPLEFKSQWLEQTKAFTVTCFPHSLRTVVIPSLDKNGMLNYLEYLKRSFILQESIMVPFLAILKDHLEDFQVFLGNVETWLKESTQTSVFLQTTFNLTFQKIKQVGHNYILQRTKYPSSDTSMYNLSFDISTSKGRERLTQFFAFITNVDTCE